MAAPELIIFDCDGVLVDSEMIANRVLARLLSGAGLEITANQCGERFIGRSIPDVVDMVEAEDGITLGDNFGNRLAKEDARAFKVELEPVAGIRNVLETITIPFCVASSGSHEKMRLTLGLTGLVDYFDSNLFSALDVRRGKPAPDLFLHAAGKMCCPPEKCLAIEDSVSGVRAARAAGMRVFGFTGGSHAGPELTQKLSEAGASAVFGQMDQLTAMIEA